MKRFWRSTSSVLFVAGLGLALWPLAQIAYARWNQHALHLAWDQAAAREAPESALQNKRGVPAKSRANNLRKGSDRALTKPNETKVSSPSSKASQASQREAKAPEAWPPTRIVIPDIGLDAVVVQGMDAASLERGPGHAPRSALPGAAGNCAIAAHRNVFGSWFLRVDELLPGSRITLKTPRQSFEYEVMQSLSVPDNDTSVLRPALEPNAAPQLTLLTCTMPRTTSRIAIRAYLVPQDDAS